MKRFLSHCDLLSFLFSLLRFSTKQRMDVYAQNINLCCIASAMPQHTGKGIDIETKTAHKKNRLQTHAACSKMFNLLCYSFLHDIHLNSNKMLQWVVRRALRSTKGALLFLVNLV